MMCAHNSLDIQANAQIALDHSQSAPTMKNFAPTFKVVSTLKDFQELKSEWNGLLEQTGADRIYMTHEWFTAWWQAFGEGKDLFIVLVRDGERLCGIVPLMRFKGSFRGMPVRVIGFMENDDSPGCSFIVEQGHDHQLIEGAILFLTRDVGCWDILSFKNMPEDDAIKTIRSLEICKRKSLLTVGLRSPYVNIDTNWEAFFNNVSARRRKTLKNIRNRVTKLGDITVKEHESAEKLHDMEVISKRAWKYKEGMAFTSRSDRYRFFELLSQVSEANGWLSIWLMYKADQPVAYEYHLKYKKTDTALISDFDEEYGNASPGAYLDFEIVKTLFESGTMEYDMCGSQDDYKKKWTDSIRNRRNILAFNVSWRARLLYLIERRVIGAVKCVLGRNKDMS